MDCSAESLSTLKAYVDCESPNNMTNDFSGNVCIIHDRKIKYSGHLRKNLVLLLNHYQLIISYYVVVY